MFVMYRIDNIYKTVKETCLRQYRESGNVSGISTMEVCEILGLERTNVSSDLNKLFRLGKVEKADGKPVLYKIKSISSNDEKQLKSEIKADEDIFENIIGAKYSLGNAIQQAKAAIIYPSNKLHTLIYGETGTGKSMFAEIMYRYAVEIGRMRDGCPFVTFNCADYANNPQLLMAQLFGVKKGAYTGAENDRTGLVEKADGGVLFLDEVHRLPSEGQEMLFSLIDKGVFRKLGESNNESHVNVFIICATTENIESSLLKTFIRRIPMIIKLPPLRERTLAERYELIMKFFKEEALCINRRILITANTLKALLLYDCPNNIGQLRNDIKICCAKAFLQAMVNRDEVVCIHSQTLTENVLHGADKYLDHKYEIDKLIGNSDVIDFDGYARSIRRTDIKTFNFYDAIEEKRNILESEGMNKEDIKAVMSLDLNTYLKKYILNVNNENLEELYTVVNKKIVDIVEEFLKKSGEELHREFSSKILHALSMHLASTIERINSGKKIENNQLEDIKQKHSLEFRQALFLKDKVKKGLNIDLPNDEVGFIAMFLCIDEVETKDDERVAVLVAMHGDSAATSIADVANHLLGENYAVGYNMPLSQKPSIAQENITEIVKKINKGKGVIFLVDMGYLVVLGDEIHEETNIPVKTVEMVSTPMVLNATRKALLNSSLEEVYDSCIKLSPYIGRIHKDNFELTNNLKRDVILTACMTGQGAAVKLKSILEQKIGIENLDIEVIPIEISDKITFRKNIDKVKEQKNVLVIISPFNPNDKDMIYISTSEIFKRDKLIDLHENIRTLKVINNMEEVVSKNIDIDAKRYTDSFKKFYIRLYNSGTKVSENVVIGLMLHLGCAIENALKKNETANTKNHEEFIKQHMNEYKVIKEAIKPIENSFDVVFSDDEYLNVTKIVYYL